MFLCTLQGCLGDGGCGCGRKHDSTYTPCKWDLVEKWKSPPFLLPILWGLIEVGHRLGGDKRKWVKERTSIFFDDQSLLQLAASQKPCVDIFAWDPRIQLSLSWFTSLCVGYTPPYPHPRPALGRKKAWDWSSRVENCRQQRFLFVLFKSVGGHFVSQKLEILRLLDYSLGSIY